MCIIVPYLKNNTGVIFVEGVLITPVLNAIIVAMATAGTVAINRVATNSMKRMLLRIHFTGAGIACAFCWHGLPNLVYFP